MKFPTILLSIIILISCQKDISKQFIQPPKYKGENVSEVFPYVKYTAVKTYSFNSPDTIYIANRKIPIERIKLFKDSLHNTFWEDVQYENFIEYDEMVYKHIYDSLFRLEYGTHSFPITKDGDLVQNATYHGKFNRKEVNQLSYIFRQDTRPRPVRECIPTYRDAILFFDIIFKSVAPRPPSNGVIEGLIRASGL